MKVALTLIGSLLTGFLLKDIFAARRRVIASVVLGATSFVLVMASVLLGLIDLALQFEAQGFILWNAMLGVATLLLALGIGAAFASKAVFPKPKLHLGAMGSMDAQELIQSFEQVVAGFMSMNNPPPAPPPSPGTEEIEVEREETYRPTVAFGQPVHS